MPLLIYHQDITKVIKKSKKIIGNFYKSCGFDKQLHLLKKYGLSLENGEIIDSIATRLNYHGYPYLFYEVFPTIARDELIELGVATQLYAEYAILLDKLIDQQKSGSEIITILSLSNYYRQEEALKLFHKLMDRTPEFWRYKDKYRRQHFLAIIKEKMSHQGSVNTYLRREMEIISHGKHALAKIVPVAMGLMADDEEKIKPLTKSQDLFTVGFQLYDDLRDWRIDYRKKNFSYLLTRILLESNLGQVGNLKELPDEDTVGRSIFFSGLYNETLQMADEYFKKAIDCVKKLSCASWLEYIETSRKNCQVLREDLENIGEHIIKKTKSSQLEETGKELKVPESVSLESLRKAILKGINFLLRQQENDFPEARHLEILGRSARAPHQSACQWGDTFQRALILDSLIALRDENFPIPESIVKQEVRKIIEAKLKTRKGGWSYFPQISSLPPDADDLGQIIQVLVKSKYDKVREVCEEPIDILVKYNTNPDGSIDTWIAFPKEEGSVEAKLNMQQVWGINPDTEVGANILYGLYLYDRKRFESQIRRGTKFIEKKQLSKGYWECNWYCGKYYGTWVCSRLIKLHNGQSPSLKRGIDFVVMTQNSDGGWGQNGKSNALDTSFGLLTISLSAKKKKMRNHIIRALHFLQHHQQEESWEASEFIKVDLGKRFESLGDKNVPPVNIYKSRTITTAFCLKAMLTGLKFINK